MSHWIGRGQRDRELLVGMRFAITRDVLEHAADITRVEGALPLRGGADRTMVAEATDQAPLVAGPVYWLKPSAPEDRGWAECASCGDMSNPYRPSARRFALAWAHRHRCPR